MFGNAKKKSILLFIWNSYKLFLNCRFMENNSQLLSTNLRIVESFTLHYSLKWKVESETPLFIWTVESLFIVPAGPGSVQS